MTAAAPLTVGFDGSPSSRDALAWGLSEAALRGRNLRVVYCLVSPITMAGVEFAPVPDLALLDSLRAAAHTLIDEAVATARTACANIRGVAGVEVDGRVIIGSPSGVLIEEGDTSELLVVGSRGYGGFRGLLLGSVGVQTASHARCPTVVVRGPAPETARSVVVGVDGSEVSHHALGFAFNLASRHGWDLIAVHAWELPAYDLLAAPAGPAPALFSEIADEELRLAAEQLAGFGAQYPDVSVEERIIKAPPIFTLLEAAEGAACLVVGSRGRGEVMGTLLGSVSQGVLHRATIPVAVVHPVSDS